MLILVSLSKILCACPAMMRKMIQMSKKVRDTIFFFWKLIELTECFLYIDTNLLVTAKTITAQK